MQLIRNIKYGSNEQGFNLAHVLCNLPNLHICGEAIDTAIGIANVWIASRNDKDLVERIEIPFKVDNTKPNETYTTIQWFDKDEVTIIIVPLSFILSQ